MRTKTPSAVTVLVSLLACVGTLELGLAVPSAAAVLPFRNGRLTIRVDAVGNQYPLPAPANGSASGTVDAEIAGATLTSLTIPAGAFSVSGVTTPVTEPPLFPTIRGLVGTFANAAGSFSTQGGGGFGGSMGLRHPDDPGAAGVVDVCISLACNPPFGLVPVGLGVVGVDVDPQTVEDLITYTISGAPWTLGTASVPVDGGDDVESGSLTVLGDGSLRVRLVSPIAIDIDTTGLPDTVPSKIAAFGILTLDVPEPGSTAGGLASMAALSALARRRRARAARVRSAS